MRGGASLQAKRLDGFDEELELELEDRQLQVPGMAPDESAETRSERQRYFRELSLLQGELVKLQDWVADTEHKVVTRPHIELPERLRNPDYLRQPVLAQIFVPERY